MNTQTPTHGSAGTAPQRTALSRTAGLARFNLTLMMRNRTTMIYGLVIPLIPLGLLFTISADAPAASVSAMVTTTWLMALIFPGFYNLLSMFVSRRDELVLKRLRTGEVRDVELIGSMVAPGALLTAAAAVLSVPIVLIAGFSLPTNPLLLIVALAAGIVTFAAFALWTASWTRTAEGAQLTSAPVMLLAMVGTVAPVVPESVGRWLDLTPGAAIGDLIAVSWFGLTEAGTDQTTATIGEAFTAALPPLGVLAVWTLIALELARRSMRWEPRA